MVEVKAKPTAATRSWCGVRSAMMPPSSTPAALNSRKPDRAMLATAAGVPWMAPRPTTVKVWMPPLAMAMQKKNSRLRRIGALSSRSSPTLAVAP